MTRRVLFVHDGPIAIDGNGVFHGYGYRGCYERYSQLGDEVVFAIRTRQNADAAVYDALPKELKVVSIPDFKHPIKYFRNMKEAKAVIAKEIDNADVFVLRLSSAANIAEGILRKKQIPYIYECVGCVWDSLTNHSFLGKLIAPWSFLKQRRVIRRAPYVHYVTNEFLQHRYPTDGVAIGCSDVIVTPASENVLNNRLNKVAERCKSNSRKVVLGTAASVDIKYKGQATVIRAIPQLMKRGIQVEYYLAGGNTSGSTRLSDLADKLNVTDSVHFVGSLPSADMPEFYDSLDVYVQPSMQEGLPRSVVEAMSRGCPVIGSNAGGIPELIQSDQVFRKGSARSFVERLCDLLSSDLSRVCERNYRKAKQFDADLLQQKLYEFYARFNVETQG